MYFPIDMDGSLPYMIFSTRTCWFRFKLPRAMSWALSSAD